MPFLTGYTRRDELAGACFQGDEPFCPNEPVLAPFTSLGTYHERYIINVGVRHNQGETPSQTLQAYAASVHSLWH
jgi:hypothetical protein